LRGQVVLVNFWATWCVPCRTEMPVLQSVYAEHRAEGFTIIAINVAEDKDTVAPFAKEFNLTFPILLDRNTVVSNSFSVSGLPTSFFIDRNGVIRAVYLGAMYRAYVESQLAPLLETR
jgi:thiol-disulfide isomerase/thioredoxin